MHILYIHQHFTTNQGATGTRSYDYARYLVQRGHLVTVVSGVYALGPFAGQVSGLVDVKEVDGIRVVLINVPYANQMRMIGRVMSFVLFALLSVLTCLRQGRVDVVLATSTPLTVGIPALAMKWLRRVPYVFETRDIWPEFAISMGILTNPLVIRLASLAERVFYRNAAKVQAISPGMVEHLSRRVPREKLTMIPTGVDLSLYDTVRPDDSLRRELGWQDRLIAVYAGAHSNANGLEYVIDAADSLRNDPRVGFLMIGEGRSKDALVMQARTRGLTNISFQPKMPKDRLVGVIADADVGMLILQAVPEFTIALPNKLFDYLAGGLAVAVNFTGDASNELSRFGAGLATDPTNPRTLADALGHWAANRDQLAASKAGARELARYYDRRDWAGKLEAVLREASGRH